jgi:hypothetical protein
MLGGKRASLGGAAAAALLGMGAQALAAAPMLQNIMPFGDNRGQPTPPVARYIGVDGQSFVFDRDAARPLLKFDDDPEVWVLEPSPAPRGDVVYRNDAGVTVLRSTRLGGLTLFTSEEPGGLPAAILGEAELQPPPPALPPGALLQRMIQAGLHASRAAQHPITFYAPNVPPQSEPLFADAAIVAADAVGHMSRRTDGRAFLAKLEKFVFLLGAKPDVSVSGPVMQITVAPGQGFAGRPSSDRLLRAALHR